MDRKILIIGLLCILPFFSFGENIDSLKIIELQDSTKILDQRVSSLESYKNDTLFWLKALGGFMGITILSLFGLYFHILNKAKEYAVAAVEKEIDAIVEKSLSQKLGVKLDLVSSFFTKLKNELEAKKEPILIVSSSKGRQSPLAQSLEKDGYSNLKFISIDEITKNESNLSKVILFNNKNGQLTEIQISSIIDNFINNFDAFICYGVKLSEEKFRKYQSEGVTFVNNDSALKTNLLDALKDKGKKRPI